MVYNNLNNMEVKRTSSQIKNHNIAKYNNFLKKYITNDSFTHLAVGKPFKKFNIPDDVYSEYIDLHTDALLADHPDLHICEKPKDVGPLCIDIDLNFNETHGERQYNKKHIQKLVKIIKELINYYYKVNKNNLKAFVLEKDHPSYKKDKKMYKDGIHIVYPNLPLHKHGRLLLMDEIKKKVISTGIFDDIPYTNDITDVFDATVIIVNGWMMHGANKATWNKKKNKLDIGQFYKLTYIYKSSLKKEKLDKYTNEILPKMLCVRKYSNNDALLFNDEVNNISFGAQIDKLATLYDKSYKNTKLKKLTNKPKKHDPKNKEIDYYPGKKIILDEESQFAVKLIGLLSTKRSSSYDKWSVIGWTLFNINQCLFDEWISFSKKGGDKYDYDGCCDIWNKAKQWHEKNPDKSGTGIGTLKVLAKEDNSTGYTEILREKLRPYLLDASSGTHTDIAKAIYEKYKDEFICAGIKTNEWYQFQGHRWVIMESARTLSLRISDEMTNDFANLIQWYYSKMDVITGQEKDATVDKVGFIQKVINKLKNTGFKKDLITECALRFKKEKFGEQLDSNKDLIGFENGVYDLALGKFRDGRPDDYITLSTGYDYKEFTMNDPTIKQIVKYFDEIMTESDMREYTLTLISSYLDGHNKDQKLIVWTGTGANSKTLCVNLIERTLGGYASTLPPTVLTQRRKDPSSASPEMADKRGKRFVVIQEPESDEKIFSGFMKQLTGGDKIQTRQLYKEMFEFVPQFKVLLVCNDLPAIPAQDGGTWRRVRVTPYESKFVKDKKKLNKPKHFYRDDHLPDRMSTWNQAFAWYLINIYYPKYKNDGLTEPKKVTKHTDEYQKESDIYHEFIEENLEITGNDKDSIDISTLYENFKDWFNSSHGTGNAPSKKILKNYFKKTDKECKIKGSFLYGAKESTAHANVLAQQLEDF
jgi:P4 family phage/plasmid primase-like protien